MPIVLRARGRRSRMNVDSLRRPRLVLVVAALLPMFALTTGCGLGGPSGPSEAQRRLNEIRADRDHWLASWPGVRNLGTEEQACGDSTPPTMLVYLEEQQPGGRALLGLPDRLRAAGWRVNGPVNALRGTRNMPSGVKAHLGTDLDAAQLQVIVQSGDDQLCP